MPPGVNLACHNQAKPVPVVDLSLCCVLCRSWSSMLAVITCSGRCVADAHARCLGLDAQRRLKNVLWSTTVQQPGCPFANVGLPTQQAVPDLHFAQQSCNSITVRSYRQSFSVSLTQCGACNDGMPWWSMYCMATPGNALGANTTHACWVPCFYAAAAHSC